MTVRFYDRPFFVYRAKDVEYQLVHLTNTNHSWGLHWVFDDVNEDGDVSTSQWFTLNTDKTKLMPLNSAGWRIGDWHLPLPEEVQKAILTAVKELR
jgi:hypothetical protein